MVLPAGNALRLARLSRHRALVRRVCGIDVSARARGVDCAVSHALAWRTRNAMPLESRAFASGRKTTPPLPSLTIAEAFDGDDDEDEDGGVLTAADDELSFGLELDEDDGDQTTDPNRLIEETTVASSLQLSEEEQRELAKQLKVAMDRKKQWMARLADAGAFDTLLKVVYECYEPLYATHVVLQNGTCPLWNEYEDAVAVADAKTRFRPKWYDDQVTKITEQEAMALFTSKHRPELAMAVFRHREWLAAELGSVTVSRGGNVLTDDVTVDLTKHFRSFYSWAMGASSALGDHTQVFTIYETALEHGVFPTANMTVAYLNSLIAKREFEAVSALFEQIQKDDRPTNLYFYRQMLFFARLTYSTQILDVVLSEMKIKGFKLRAEDYLNAIRTQDELCFHRRATSEQAPVYLLNERYSECVARVADQETFPDKYKEREKACGKIIKLFEEMIEDEQIAPHSEQFFPRVIAAAMFLQDYDRVTDTVAMHERVFNKPLTDIVSTRTAVNALLVKDDPVAAWGLVIATDAVRSRPSKHNKKEAQTVVARLIGNIIEYLMQHDETDRVLELLHALDTKRLLGPALPPSHSTKLLQMLVEDTKVVSDQTLWKTVDGYWVAFPVRTRKDVLTKFVEDCIRADRWWVVSKALRHRDRTKIPTIASRLALDLSTKALEMTSDLERVELVSHLVKMVDVREMNADARLTLCCNAIRALHILRTDSSRGLHRQREINRIHEQYLRGKGQNIPEDVREILLQQR